MSGPQKITPLYQPQTIKHAPLRMETRKKNLEKTSIKRLDNAYKNVYKNVYKNAYKTSIKRL